MTPAGRIEALRDEGTIWQVVYKDDQERTRVVNFDWRMFAQMYESESGRSFAEDYATDLEAIHTCFLGRGISVEGDPFDQRVSFGDLDVETGDVPRGRPLDSPNDYLNRYPRLCAHIICHSLGYATPMAAARILMNAHLNRPDHCEWISSCYGTDARKAVEGAICGRHFHRGYMADFDLAYRLVRRAVETGDEPLLGSWF